MTFNFSMQVSRLLINLALYGPNKLIYLLGLKVVKASEGLILG
jgi:hypothetical protein